MNSKNIAKVCKAKINNWLKSIDNEEVKNAIQKDAIITGGALVSLLTGEKPNDYDIYFKTLESCKKVAEYYANKWNKLGKSNTVEIKQADDRIECFIRSTGIALDDNESGIDDITEPYVDLFENPVEPNSTVEKPKYRPRYFSTNAISLSDDIQIVIRFCGEADKIHENYDFEHCKCSYDYKNDKVNLPAKALECIINKELFYSGSKYPLCSIIRTRKFISRGWTINAGQYVKMALQLNELDLMDMNIFKEQLVGVDSAYFNNVIEYIINKQKEDSMFKIDGSYLIEVINRIF